MPFSADTIKPPLHDQITEMKRKIQLLEREKTAYYESSQSTIKRNAEFIRQLKQENESLRKKLPEAKAKANDAAHTTLEQTVLSKKKRLNALKHTTQTQQRHLEQLKMEYQRMRTGSSGGAQSADACTRKKEEDAMNLRALENSLEKTQLKCKKAENIMVNYEKVKSHLQAESLTYQGQLDNLEAELLKQREELHKMQALNNHAQLSKEAAKAELQQLEELLDKERKERERTIASYRKRVAELKAQSEKVDRRAQRTAIQPDELSSEAQRSTPRMAGEDEKAISTFEEAFRRIKEATGLTDIQEIVERFKSQKETHQHLENVRGQNEKLLQQLREQKELLSQQLQDMKYSREAKVSSDQQMLEEREQQLQAQQQRCDASKERLEKLVKDVSTIRAGVEHLADKLQHITLSEDVAADVSPDSDEFVLALMTQCGLKLQLLQEELQGKDLDTVMKEMEEFYDRIEGKMPAHNTRVKLTDNQSLDLLNDEEESDEDDADVLTREALKRQSQLIIESKKKKPCKKKKKKGHF